MACEYYKYQSGLFSGDYYCIKKECVVSSDTYEKYCRGWNFRECPIFNHTESSGCFLTTVVCEILGKQDNDKVLENFRFFRDYILQPNPEYHDLLKEYDVIGPILADHILNDKDNQKLAKDLYENLILPVNAKINQQEYNQAIETYYVMTLFLIGHYQLKHQYNGIKDNNYNNLAFVPEKAGHG